MLEHLSIFIENKPGKLNRIMEALAEAKINLRAYAIAGAGEFGVLKILVDNPDEASSVLSIRGLAVAKRPILMVAVDDTPGALFKLLNILSSNGVNVSDSYGFLTPDNKAAIVLECNDYDRAAEVIRENRFKLFDNTDALSAI